MSITSQRSELERKFGVDVEIVEVIEEAYSAKAPGRPLFNAMMERIERGEAQGLVAWAPDRLARNSVDGGRIVYLLDTGVLRDLKFATYTFENNPQGKFMLSIMFGQSKYYSDALSENVKRGLRTKLEAGWKPSKLQLGYKHDPYTKTVLLDDEHAPFIRRMFDLALRGVPAAEIHRIARDEWGYRTPQKRRRGGTPLARASVYRILNDRFYVGQIVWGGRVYPGKHTPIVTLDEFALVQRALHAPAKPRKRKLRLPYTGLIRCGACGRMVTGETKVNRHGSTYTYYHCTRGSGENVCRQPAIRAEVLERQLEEMLWATSLPQPIADTISKFLAEDEHLDLAFEERRRASVHDAIGELDTQARELTSLRIRQLITDEEFATERKRLDVRRLELTGEASEPGHSAIIEPLRDLITLRKYALYWFRAGDERVKRMIIKTVGSNLTLSEKKLNYEAALSFIRVAPDAENPLLCGLAMTNRTFIDKLKEGLSNELSVNIKATVQRLSGTAEQGLTELPEERHEPS